MNNRTRQVVVLGSRIIGAGLQLAVVLVVGRLLGSAVLGQYLVFQAAVRLAGTVVGWGHPWHVLRTVSELDELGESDDGRRVFRTSIRSQCRLIGVCALIAAPFLVWSTWSGRGPLAGAVGWAALMAAAGFALTSVAANGLKARMRQPMALFLEFSAVPLAVAAAALLAHGLSRHQALVWLTVAHGTSALTFAAVGVALFARTPAPPAGPAATPEAAADMRRRADLSDRAAARTRLTFGSTNVVNMIGQNAPSLLLALVLPFSALGQLGAVLRLTAIPGTFAVGLTSIYGPRFAKLWVARNQPALRSTLRETQLWMTGLYLPFALAFVVFPALVTDQLGSDFQGSANALRIMGVAQLINALTGQAPMMLSMCRDEVQALVRMSIGVVLGLALSVLGAVAWGVNGAAIGLAIGLAAQNLTMWVRAHTLMGTAVEGTHS